MASTLSSTGGYDLLYKESKRCRLPRDISPLGGEKKRHSGYKCVALVKRSSPYEQDIYE
jgi:hypothetical protein